MDVKHASMNMPGSIITGMALGVLIGVLFAPRSGEETRMKLKNAGEQFKKKTEDTKEQILEKVDDGIDTARNTASKYADKAEGAVESTRSRINRSQNNEEKGA